MMLNSIPPLDIFATGYRDQDQVSREKRTGLGDERKRMMDRKGDLKIVELDICMKT